MNRFLAIASILVLTALRGRAATLERWVYVQANLAVPAELDRVEALIKRARPLGFRNFMLADSKFAKIWEMNAAYHQNIKRLRAVAKEYDVEIVPSVFPVGYSNDLLWHDPNLAEGLPVRDALYVVSNGVANVVADPPVNLPPMSERRRWGFIDDNLQTVENGLRVVDPKGANARAMARVIVAPFRQYHVSVRLKTSEFRGQPEIKVLVNGNRALSYTALRAKPTQNWRTHDITFNSLEHTNVSIYFGAWGASSGSLWLADAKMEEAGLVNVLRRDGTPFIVRRETGGELREGTEFETFRDPRMGNQPWAGEYEVWHGPPSLKTKLPNGTRLRISYFHPHVIYEGQVCGCVSEPKFDQLLERSARELHKAWNASGYMMAHDEWRVLGWDEACRRRGLDTGAMVAANARQCADWLRGINPGGRILVWNDMFDPHHNAVANYYLVRGDLRGAWEGLGQDIVIVNWNFGKRNESLKFFADRGHKQLLAGYYDAGPDQIGKWLEASRTVPGVIGVMYTTWQRKFDDLEGFAKVVDRFEKN